MSEYLNIPNEQEVKRLYSEYGMTKEKVKQDVAQVRKWMLTQPHFPVFPESKNDEINFWIESYLRLTKNNLQNTQTALDKYFQLKAQFPQVCNVNDLLNYVESEVFDYLTMVMLPKHTSDGLKVMYYSFSEHNSHLFNPVEIYRRMYLMLKLYQKKGIDFTGIHVVINAKNMKTAHLNQFDLFQLRDIITLSQKAFPLRLKNNHIMFPPTFLDVAKNILLPFLSKKMASRLTFHKNYESLWQHIPRDILPIEFGGYSGSLDTVKEEWKTLILKNSDWFVSNVKYMSDESKRPKRMKSLSSICDEPLQSFKKLDID